MRKTRTFMYVKHVSNPKNYNVTNFGALKMYYRVSDVYLANNNTTYFATGHVIEMAQFIGNIVAIKTRYPVINAKIYYTETLYMRLAINFNNLTYF